MIIRCRKCETRYRFDDNLMAGDGVWVRCSRCSHVFFQDNPEKEVKNPPPPASNPTPSAPVPEAPAQPEAEPEENESQPRETGEENVLSTIEEIREAMKGEDKGLEMAVQEFNALERLDVENDEEDEPDEEEKKGSVIGKFFAYLFLFLLAVLLAGGLYLLVFPEARQDAVRFLSPYFPMIERLSGKQARQTDVADQVSIQDVRQHFVSNLVLGNLRVVEGIAVNVSQYPLTQIQVRGRLYDKEDKMLGETLAFCGNYLTDSELAAMTEDEIRQKLSQPLGSNVSGERIRPSGQIPFMLVFTQDSPLVDKVTVMLAGAEKLLE